MNGGERGNSPASIRGEKVSRIIKQNKFLNHLRLIYFLQPTNLDPDTFETGNPKIEKLLHSIGVTPGGYYEEEVISGLCARDIFHEALSSAKSTHLQESMTIEGRERIKNEYKNIAEEYERSWKHHWLQPETIPMFLRGENPKKKLDFEILIKKVIAYQTFELKKREKPREKVSEASRPKPLSYADHLQRAISRGNVGISQREGRKYVKEAKLREEGWSDAKKTQKLDDKILARKLYKATNKATLARVRQDRKRLKGYYLL